MTQLQTVQALSSLDDQTLIEFVEDTIQNLKGYKVGFLSKYSEAFGGQTRMVIPAKDLLLDLVQLALRKT